MNVSIGADWRVSGAGAAAVSLAAGAGAAVAVVVALGKGFTGVADAVSGVAFGSMCPCGTAQAAALSRMPDRVMASWPVVRDSSSDA
ncbi:hypothetical protein [Arthrobacter sp. UYCu723]